MQLALVLACVPFAAQATAFKCTAANGQTSYQDTPCQVGAAEKSVELSNSSSALVTLMADAGMIGRKAGKAILAQVYQMLGETSPEPAPVLTVREQIELQQFVQTSAGRLLIDQKFVVNSDVAPAISKRVEELKKNCGAHR